MLKTLSNLVVGLSKTTSSWSRLSSVRFASSTASGGDSSNENRNKNKKKNVDDDDDGFGYLKSNAAKARLLERFGMVKPYAKWPQYNRVVYPPSSDGKPVKNPVNNLLNEIILLSYLCLSVSSSLCIICEIWSNIRPRNYGFLHSWLE